MSATLTIAASEHSQLKPSKLRRLSSFGSVSDAVFHGTILTGKSLRQIQESFSQLRDNELKPKGDSHFICSERQATSVVDVGSSTVKKRKIEEFAQEPIYDSLIDPGSTWYRAAFYGIDPDTDGNILSERSLKFISGSCYLPKDNESKPAGEDAHFICDEDKVIGVADGVGGWSKKGIDSGEYARQLMSNSVIAIQNKPRSSNDPTRVLEEAYLNTKAEGAATACIVAITDQCLHAVSIGDSGFLVFREGGIAYSSPVQQHSFNCPYQLGNSADCDQPSSAQILKVEIKAGDIIILGSDGLFDNLFKKEIKEAVVEGIKDGIRPEIIATTLANLALYNSFDKYCSTPFSEASRNAGYNHPGGKIDDITVVVTHIVASDDL